MNFNILGIGLPQIAIVVVLSLVLFGPKQMLQYAYQAGRFLAKARAMWEEAARNMQQEMQNSGVDLKEFQNLGQGLQQDWNKAINGTLNDLNGIANKTGTGSPVPYVNNPPYTGASGVDPSTLATDGLLTSTPSLNSSPNAAVPPVPATSAENIPPPALSTPTASLDLSDVERPEQPVQDDTDQTKPDQSKKYDAWLLN